MLPWRFLLSATGPVPPRRTNGPTESEEEEEGEDDDDDDDDPRDRSGNATLVGIVYFRSPEQPDRIPEQSDRVREEPEIVMGLDVGANRLASNLQTPPAPSS